MPTTPFMGEIMYFAGDFAPRGWALCNGQSLSIAQYSALYTLLGTTFGGDGKTAFNLPDLRGRAIMGGGVSVGGSGTTTAVGAITGSEQIILTLAQMPAHSHPLSVSNAAGMSPTPATGTLAASSGQSPDGPFTVSMYAADLASSAPMASGMISSEGGGGAHENRQPFAVLNACIALTGVFPPRA